MTTHVLINLIENIRQTLNLVENIGQTLYESTFGYSMFVDFQKTFDTFDHKILLHKLKYYDITKWFKLYLSNPKHFVTVNGYNSDLMPVDYSLPQGSVPGPFLSLIYSQ